MEDMNKELETTHLNNIGENIQMKNKVLELDKEERTKDTVVPFKLLTGGKDLGDNWLSTLAPGAVFLSAPKEYKGFDREEWHVDYQAEKHTKLMNNIRSPHNPKGMELEKWVGSLEFSSANNLLEVLSDGDT